MPKEKEKTKKQEKKAIKNKYYCLLSIKIFSNYMYGRAIVKRKLARSCLMFLNP